MNAYVVTTSIGGNRRTIVWDSSSPLALGHPFRWILERTEEGVRIRDISCPANEIQKNSAKELSHDKLEKGAEIEFEKVSFRLRSVQPVQPAYAEASGDHLSVFACAGDWVLEATPVGQHYVGYWMKKPAFVLDRKGGGKFKLSVRSEGLRWEPSSGAKKELTSKESLELSLEDLAGSAIRAGTQVWRLGITQAPVLPVPNRKKGSALAIEEEETRWYRKALSGTALALVLFMTMAWFWPKPQENPQELIPPQVAKLILQTPKKESAAPSGDQQNVAAAKTLPKKVQDAAVVQAFRAKALQSAVSGLLKGGMTRLLAQSDFVTGVGATQDARRIFESKNAALKATGPEIGQLQDKNVKVASLGGSDAKGVGYGKGEHAGVNGQGHSFVSMDIVGANVEEGLTKDEVGEVIHRHLSEVRYCYESAMIRTPDIEGKLIVNFTIGGNGMVKSSEVKQSTLPDPRLDDCILRRLVTWKFPNPKGGVDVAVSYPFIFKTLGR